MNTAFNIIFLVLFVICWELTYVLALRQSFGLVRHIWCGDICWINHVLIAVITVWYLGWIAGILLTAFALFGMFHATIGWILTIPTTNTEERTLELISSFECGLLLFLNLAVIAFGVLSFIFSDFRSALVMFKGNITVVYVIAALFVVGFIVRSIVMRKMTKTGQYRQ